MEAVLILLCMGCVVVNIALSVRIGRCSADQGRRIAELEDEIQKEGRLNRGRAEHAEEADRRSREMNEGFENIMRYGATCAREDGGDAN